MVGGAHGSQRSVRKTAEPIVSYVVNKFSDYLLQEASLLLGDREDVEWLERELWGMLSFLKDAESKRKGSDERVKNWVREVRDVAYEAEDVIEDFMFKVGKQPAIRHASFFKLRYKIDDKIEKIKSTIREISDRRDRYGISKLDETGGQGSNSSMYESLQVQRRLSPHHYDDASIVGLEKDKIKIVQQLLNNEKRRCVISIVGMGGPGKSTLAKKIYNSNEVKTTFDVRAWVSASQDYRVPELLKKIIEDITGKKKQGELDEEELKRILYEKLRSRGRYLIVMDDVSSKEVWKRIQTTLLDVRNGSRVIFTTGLKDVARYADPAITPHEPRILDEEESRKLFLKKVYPNQDVDEFLKELKDVGAKLVEKCGGLPLALVVLGGLVSTKEKNHYHWLRLLNNLNWETTKEGKCLDILRFSYEAMPYHLKPCFLYIGAFPEDKEIRAKKLMRIWIAEGFIPQIQGEIREDIAEVFLEELVQRCVIQVAHRRWNDSVKKIRIHDFLCDLCIMEAEVCGFLHVRSTYQPISSIKMTT